MPDSTEAYTARHKYLYWHKKQVSIVKGLNAKEILRLLFIESVSKQIERVCDIQTKAYFNTELALIFHYENMFQIDSTQ